MLLTAVSVLAGCAGRTGFVEGSKLDLKPAPADLARPCANPTQLPEQQLSQAQVEALWQRDRANLKFCKREKAAVVEYYRARDAAIMKR